MGLPPWYLMSVPLLKQFFSRMPWYALKLFADLVLSITPNNQSHIFTSSAQILLVLLFSAVSSICIHLI